MLFLSPALGFLDQGDKNFSFCSLLMLSSIYVFMWFPIYFLETAVSVMPWVELPFGLSVHLAMYVGV